MVLRLIFVATADTFPEHSFTAIVRLGSEKPFLLLEDIEDYLESVYCSGSTIEIYLATAASHNTKTTFEELIESYLISSHYGCNGDGSRVPYL